jgi:hypothetical protein
VHEVHNKDPLPRGSRDFRNCFACSQGLGTSQFHETGTSIPAVVTIEISPAGSCALLWRLRRKWPVSSNVHGAGHSSCLIPRPRGDCLFTAVAKPAVEVAGRGEVLLHWGGQAEDGVCLIGLTRVLSLKGLHPRACIEQSRTMPLACCMGIPPALAFGATLLMRGGGGQDSDACQPPLGFEEGGMTVGSLQNSFFSEWQCLRIHQLDRVTSKSNSGGDLAGVSSALSSSLLRPFCLFAKRRLGIRTGGNRAGISGSRSCGLCPHRVLLLAALNQVHRTLITNGDARRDPWGRTVLFPDTDSGRISLVTRLDLVWGVCAGVGLSTSVERLTSWCLHSCSRS